MRIAIFTDTYTPQINGVVTSVHAFKAELERQGHIVHVWAPSSSRVRAEKDVHRVRAFTFAPYPEYKISVPNPTVVDEFARFNADVIHVQTPISIGFVGLGLAKHFKIPIVGTFHTMLPDYLHYLVNSRLQKFIMKPARHIAWNMCRWFYNRCDVVISPSSGIARLLKGQGITRPIHVIPTGITMHERVSEHEIDAFRRKFKLVGKTLLHVGRVTKEKNIEAIIDCLDDVPDAMLAISSDGPHRKELQNYVRRKNLTSRVKFLGYLEKRDLSVAYHAANLFVCASQTETQGIVLLEAAAAGLPIVALDAPVVSEFVRENRAGIVANTDEFAQKISEALTDAKLRTLVRSRAKTVAKKYEISRCAKELVEVYKLAAKLL